LNFEPFLDTVNKAAGQNVGIMSFKLEVVKFKAMADFTGHKTNKKIKLI